MKRTTATTDLDALKATVSLCEWCFRNRPLQPHHVAMGFRFKAVDDAQLCLLICDDCHRVCHRLAGDDARCVGLALLAYAGRGGVEYFWKVTERKWPEQSQVDHWIDRLGLKHRS